MLAEAPRSEPESEARPARCTIFLVAAEAPIAAAMTTEPAHCNHSLGARDQACTRSLAPTHVENTLGEFCAAKTYQQVVINSPEIAMEIAFRLGDIRNCVRIT